MTLGKVSIAVEAALAHFESDMGRASRILEKEAKQWKSQLKQYEQQAREIGKAAGVAIAAGAVAAAVALKQTINQMDDLSKAAQRVGLPTEELSKLNYAADLADVSLENLQATLGKVTKAQAAALKENSEQGKIFRALGIDVTDVSGKLRRSSDILLDFSDKFAALKGSPEAMAAGFAIFGKNFQSIVPLIKDGSQAIREAGEEAEIFGIVVSTQAGKQAEEFNDNLTRLKSAAAGLAIQVATELLPKMVELTNDLVELTKEGGSAAEIAGVISTGFQVVGGAAIIVSSNIRAVTADLIALGNVGQSAWQALTGDWRGAANSVARAEEARKAATEEREDIVRVFTGGKKPAVKVNFAGRDPEPLGMFRKSEGQVRAEGEAARLQAELQKVLKGDKPGGKSKKAAKPGKTDEEREAEALKRSYEQLLEQQRERIALFGKEGEAASVAYDVTSGSLSKLTQAQKDELLANARRLDQMSEEQKVAEELKRINEQREQDSARMLQDLEDEIRLLGMSAEAQEVYNNLKYAGAKAGTAFGDAIADATRQGQEMRKLRSAIEDMADATRSFFEDTLDFTKGPREAFRNFVDDIRMMVVRLLADSAMKQLGKFLAGMGQGGGGAGSNAGAGGGGFGGFISMLGSFFGGGREAGGPTQRGMFYEVNESAPELYTSGGRTWLMAGARDGHVTPLASQSKGAEGGSTIIAVFSEAELNAQMSKFAKSSANERITVTHFRRNQKGMG